jgi:lipid-A-disaccharide synthase
MRACTLALATSGTVTLELALAKTPMVVAYKINKLTELILRSLLLTKYVALPNILGGEPIVPEFLQADCNPDTLTKQCHQLLTDRTLNQKQRQQLEGIQKFLLNDAGLPSDVAAGIVLEYCR